MLKNTQKGRKINQAWLILSTFAGIFALFSLLSGCGFHLKGLNQAGALSFQTVKITEVAGVRADVLRALTQQLNASGVQVVQSLALAELEIRLQPTQYQASQTSLSAQGDAASELLKMSQPFSAWQVADERLLLEATAQDFRDRRINNAAALAANQELKAIQNQMAQQLAMQILDRIARSTQMANAPQSSTSP